LDQWISWDRRCRLPHFVKLAQRVTSHRDAIIASIEHRLSNALVEAMKTKIRLIVRMAFGFHSAEAIIALAISPAADTDPRSATDYTNALMDQSREPQNNGGETAAGYSTSDRGAAGVTPRAAVGPDRLP
jgi:Transposase